jgi:hypothetical protein
MLNPQKKRSEQNMQGRIDPTNKGVARKPDAVGGADTEREDS